MQACVGLDDTVSNNCSYFIILKENSENVTPLLDKTYYLYCFLKINSGTYFKAYNIFRPA